MDEFTEVTGYHRKSAIRVLGGESRRAGEKTRLGRPRSYDDVVVVALHQVWAVAGRNLRQAACALHGRAGGQAAGVGGVAGDTGGGRSAECDERIVHRPTDEALQGQGTQEAVEHDQAQAAC